MRRILFTLALLACLVATGCITVHQRDPETIAALEAAIGNRQADYLRTVQAVKDAAENPATVTRSLRQIDFLTETELTRLRAVLLRERQKTK